MWNCVAVTRGGWGEVWGFSSRQDAIYHPLVQDGDAVVDSPESTLECWNHLFIGRVCTEVLGDRDMDARIRESVDSVDDQQLRAARLAVASQEVWAGLRSIAKAPPEDPAALCRKIAEDRRLHDEWHQREQTRRSSVTQAQAAAGTTTAAASTASTEAPKEKKIAGHAPSAKIAFGKNKEDKVYNTTDNNPKRAGTKSGDRFAKYKAGQTLEQAVAAGITAADIKWDLDHGFIVVS